MRALLSRQGERWRVVGLEVVIPKRSEESVFSSAVSPISGNPC